MKKNGFAPLIIILIIAILGVVGYFAYKNYYVKTQTPVLPSAIDDKKVSQDGGELVGIWQASASMGSGWNDRYHFYADGNYHFYPNQMVKSDLTEKKGTWQIENDELILDGKVYGIEFFGTQEEDLYPSVSIAGKQFWQFSIDPTIYGEEKFPKN